MFLYICTEAHSSGGELTMLTPRGRWGHYEVLGFIQRNDALTRSGDKKPATQSDKSDGRKDLFPRYFFTNNPRLYLHLGSILRLFFVTSLIRGLCSISNQVETL